MKKVIVCITVIAALLCVVYIARTMGNVFFMSYAVNSADKICRREYGGRLQTVSYRFDKHQNCYIVDVRDTNGLRGTISYSSERGIENGYADDSESVSRNLARGRIQNMLTAGGIYDAECSVTIAKTDGGILGEVDGKCREVLLDFGTLSSKKEFSSKIVSSFSAIRAEPFETLRAICSVDGTRYDFCALKENVSIVPEDLYSWITEIAE